MGAGNGHEPGQEDEAEWNMLCMQNRLRKPRKESKDEILRYHRMATKMRIKHEKMEASGAFVSVPLKVDCMPGFQTGVGWRNHRPPKDIDRLKTIAVDDLQLGEVHKGCVLFGRLSEQPQACGADHAVYTILQDLGNPDAIVKVSFHSGVQSTTCEQAALEFPVGSELGIQEPLFKVYKDGTTGIRVDNMQHVFGQVGGVVGQPRKPRTRWDPPRMRGTETSTSHSKPTCSHCGSEPAPGTNLKSCSGCMNASYCSSSCQKADWKKHKLVCGATGRGESSCTTDSPNLATKGFYCKDNDFKVARKGLSITPHPHFQWSKAVWAISPPNVSQDGCTATNHQFETLFCSSSPFGADVSMCHVSILEPRAESAALGVCLIKDGKIDKSWKFSSDGSKFCGDKIEPYGEQFSVGDVITVILRHGCLSFLKNGKDLGVCFSGFDETHRHYYLRGYFGAGMCNGFPVPGKANGGCMQIVHLPPMIAMDIVPKKVLRIVELKARNDLNGLAAQVMRLMPSGRVAVSTCDSGEEIAVLPKNLQPMTCGGDEPVQIQSERQTGPSLDQAREEAQADGGDEAHQQGHEGSSAAVCRTCSKSLGRSSFSKRSWKNFKSRGSLPQCQVCAEAVQDSTVNGQASCTEGPPTRLVQ